MDSQNSGGQDPVGSSDQPQAADDAVPSVGNDQSGATGVAPQAAAPMTPAPAVPTMGGEGAGVAPAAQAVDDKCKCGLDMSSGQCVGCQMVGNECVCPVQPAPGGAADDGGVPPAGGVPPTA